MRWDSIMNQLRDIKTVLEKIGLSSFESEKSRSMSTRQLWLPLNEIEAMERKDYANREEVLRDLNRIVNFMHARGPDGMSRGDQVYVMKIVNKLEEILRRLSD